MATKSITISDLSGKEIPEGEHVKVAVDYPGVRGMVELDVSAAEADKFENTKLNLVTLVIKAPGKSPRTVMVDQAAFGKLFTTAKVDDVIASARRSGGPASGGTPRSASQREKRDYSSAEWAGVEHRGRVTEAEAAWVRANLDKANANRTREGQAPISKTDDKMKKRYGF